MNPQDLKIALSASALAYFGAGAPFALAVEAPPSGQAMRQCANTKVASVTVRCKDDCTEKISTFKVKGYGDTDSDAQADAEANAARFECPKNSSRTTSLVDNYTFNHRHFADDYHVSEEGEASFGCTSCASSTSAPKNPFARLIVGRIHSLRDITQPSSFGPGVFDSYDVSLTLFAVNGVTYVDCFNPLWNAARRYSPSGGIFVDTVYGSLRSLTLKDAAGTATANFANAVTATLAGKDGERMEFEIFDLDANRKGGRLLRTVTAGGDTVLSFEYAVAASDTHTSPESKWGKSVAHDRNGGELRYVRTNTSGREVMDRIELPGGKILQYAYDAAGNLAEVSYPTGDRSVFSRTSDAAGATIVFAEAGETGVHRNKTAVYTNNIAADLLTDGTSEPAVYNQASLLVRSVRNPLGEFTYWNVNGGSNVPMWRRVYEGGGRLKFFDTAEGSFYKEWSLPNGWSTSNYYGSLTATKEKYGNWAPYSDYAANRSGRYNSIMSPDGVKSTYLYDGTGNMRMERVGDTVRRFASDARFNKTTLAVDTTGRARRMAYDDAGNMVSRKTGWLFDNALGAGVTISGLACAYYENVTSIDGLDSAAPVSVQQTDTFALGQRETASSKWAMRFTGKLVLETDGERTFRLSADDRARLYIDGMLVTDVAYNQGTKTAKVNLTAGAHDIRVDYVEFGGGQRLDLTWSGPETTDASGAAAWTLVGSNFLSHETGADELVLRPTDAASEEKWEYFPAGDTFASLQKAYVDGSGKRTEYTYDANRRLIQIKETGDNGDLVVTQTRTYDAAGNLASQSDALGRTVSYAYDARNRLVKTAYGDGTTEAVTYGTGVDANLVVARKDRAGSVTKTEYDASGRAVRVLTGYALADNEGAITQVLEKPSVTTYAYLDGTADVSRMVRDGKVTDYGYDYKGRLVSTTTHPSQNKTLVSSTTYSEEEVRLSETDPHGCRAFYAYRNPDKRLVREIRELVPGVLGQDFPVSMVIPILLEPGSTGPSTPSTNTDIGLLLQPRQAGPNPGYVITDYTLDREGRPQGSTDGRGVRTIAAYDAQGRVVSRTEAEGTSEARTTAMTYDAAGRPLTQTDALNRTTSREYFPSGRMKKVVLPDAKTNEFTYFADGKLATSKDEDGFISKRYWSPCCGRAAGQADPLGQGQVRFTDGEGRVTYVATVKNVEAAGTFGPNLPADAVVSAQTMKYDARGRLSAATRWLVVPALVNPKNPPIATDPAQGLTTTYAYYDDLSDARFAPVLAKLAEQGVILTAGSATVVTNPAGEQSFTISDGAGRLVTSGIFNK